VPAGKNLLTGNTNYDGGTGTLVDILTTVRLTRIFAMHLQSRGTNIATMVRLHLVDAVGGISPLRRDIKVPATTASTSEPLWDKWVYFRGLVIPATYIIRGQVTVTVAAGINCIVYGQEMEAP